MWLRGLLKILNMFCIGERRNVLVQFAGPALKIFLFSPTIFIRSRKASTNAIERNQLLFSTCYMLSIYWQSFPPSHYFSAWAQMTSTRWVLSKGYPLISNLITQCPPRWVPLSNFFKKSWLPNFLSPSFFGNFVSPLFFTDTPPKCKKKYFFSSETFKLLLLGCQYGHKIARRNTY